MRLILDHFQMFFLTATHFFYKQLDLRKLHCIPLVFWFLSNTRISKQRDFFKQRRHKLKHSSSRSCRSFEDHFSKMFLKVKTINARESRLFDIIFALTARTIKFLETLERPESYFVDSKLFVATILFC